MRNKKTIEHYLFKFLKRHNPIFFWWLNRLLEELDELISEKISFEVFLKNLDWQWDETYGIAHNLANFLKRLQLPMTFWGDLYLAVDILFERKREDDYNPWAFFDYGGELEEYRDNLLECLHEVELFLKLRKVKKKSNFTDLERAQLIKETQRRVKWIRKQRRNKGEVGNAPQYEKIV